jgi:hypothetical protein
VIVRILRLEIPPEIHVESDALEHRRQHKSVNRCQSGKKVASKYASLNHKKAQKKATQGGFNLVQYFD